MPITNATLAQQISDLVAYWRTRDTEYATWVAGTASGGPYADGRYALTDYLGVVKYVKSPAALQASVDGPVASALVYRDAAQGYATAATSAQTAAEAARDLALSYQTGAQAARDLALSYKNFAASSEANAQTYKNNAAASASAAAADALTADADATAAAASAAAALVSQNAAAASAAAAATFDPALYLLKTGGTLTGNLQAERVILNNHDGGLRLTGFLAGSHYWHGLNGAGDDIAYWVRVGTSNYDFHVTGGVYAPAFVEGGTALASKYAALSHTHSYLPLSGGTLTGTLNGTHGIFANSVRSDYFYSSTGDKLALQLTDSWLRLNQSAHFTSGTYTPGLFRADSGLKAGYDGTRWEVSADGIVTSRYYLDNVSTYLAEWYIDQGTGGTRPLYLRFHQGNVWYNRLKLENDLLSYVGGTTDALAAAQFRQLYLRSTGSHLTMYETDGADPADRGIIEVNGGWLNLYTHDSSANAWYLPLAANIASGDVTIGTSGIGAITVRGASTTLNSALYMNNNVFMQNNPLIYGYGGALNANDYWTTSQYATLRLTHFTAISGGSLNVPETPNNANALLSLGKHTGGYTAQLFFPDNNAIWHRNQSAGTWGAWYKVFTQANLADAWNDMLDATHGAYTDFNAVSRFGPIYLQGTLNGPGTPSAAQYYTWSQGLGSNYTFAQYAVQFAIPRAPLGGHPVLSVRYRENGTWGAWGGINASALRLGGGGISVDNGTQWRITTAYGYGDFGPANSGYFHMSTDRPYGFHIASNADFAGTFAKYNQGSVLYHNTAGRNGSVGRGTAAPTGGSDGDIYFQYT